MNQFAPTSFDRALVTALMAMETTGSRLVAWAHSHPGTGAQACFPSAIDREQYDALAKDYAGLLPLIFTRDGHVRIWGENANAVGIAGTGVERRTDDLYRLKF